jgi:hypothetical protein
VPVQKVACQLHNLLKDAVVQLFESPDHDESPFQYIRTYRITLFMDMQSLRGIYACATRARGLKEKNLNTPRLSVIIIDTVLVYIKGAFRFDRF